MNWRFTTLSIRKKITVLTLFTAFLGPAISAVIFTYYDFFHIKKDVTYKAQVLAMSIGKEVETFLKAKDMAGAARVLTSLDAHPPVRKACLMDLRGDPLALYFRDTSAGEDCEYRAAGKLSLIDGGFMDVMHPIHVGRSSGGMLYLRYELKEMTSRLKEDLAVGGIAFAVTMTILALTVFPVQSALAGAISRLAKTAEKIVRKKDFFAKIPVESRDEVGRMAESFNAMLEVVRQHDIALVRQNRKMEETVASLTQDLLEVKEEAKREKARLEASVGNARQMVDRADAANRYKSQFLANMSHEIRTPLNAILGFAQILEDRITGEAERQHLRSISASGNTLLDLINEILDLSKIEAGKLELNYYSVDIRRLFDDIQRIMARQIKDKNLEFFLEIDTTIPQALRLDGARLRQVLINLVGNAAKFTHQGYIRINVKGTPEKKDGHIDLIISVEDTGVGIASGQEEAIFEAFQQQGSRQVGDKGAGLGLAISKQLVNLMNGTLTVKSEYEKGTVFTLHLKDVTISSSSEAQPANGRSSAASYWFQPATILVVDDVRINRVLMMEFLKAFDFELFEAENGLEAVTTARQHPPDLVLMDMVMPEMDGYEATKTLKADPELSGIPVIAVTASVLEDRRAQILAAGCDGFIKKPVQKEEILEELARFLPLADTSLLSEAVHSTMDELMAQGEAEALSPQTRKRLPILIQHMESSLEPQYTQLTETMLVSDIKAFGLQVARLGEEYDLKFLRKWGERLSFEADRFNVDGMTEFLRTYPLLLESITSHLEQ